MWQSSWQPAHILTDIGWLRLNSWVLAAFMLCLNKGAYTQEKKKLLNL